MDGKYRRYQKISKIVFIFSLVILKQCLFAEGTKEKSVSYYDKEIKKSMKQLEEIRIELEKGREKLNTLQREEGTYAKQLEQIEKNISTSYKYLKMLSLRIDTVENIIKKLGDSLIIMKENLDNRTKIMKLRLRDAYMHSNVPPIFMIFTVENPIDIINKVRYLEEINRYDRQMIKDIKEMKTLIEDKKEAEEKEMKHLSKLLTAKEEEQKKLLSEEKLQKEMLKKTRSEKEKYEAMIKELENSQKELEKMIKLLEDKRKKLEENISKREALSFEKSKGRLPWPVDGSIINGYGKIIHPQYGTVTVNNGIDISAREEESISCIANGTVIHTGHLKGLGLLVIVDHYGGYLSIYSNLKSINVKVDQKIKMGTILGTAGRKGDRPMIHFEIRKGTTAIDPTQWLEKR